MSDIVERLRDVPDSKLSAYAADEIDRLEARLAEAERLLRRTVEPTNPYDFLMVLNDMEAFLRAAVSASVTNEATK